MTDANGDTGFARVPRAVLQARGLSGQAKLIYALLQARAYGKGTCYPSLALLAEESGWSKPTVIKAIDELVSAGLVERQHQRFQNVYHLTDSMSLNPSPDGVKPVECNDVESVGRSKAGLPTDSTSFTDGVKQVDTKKSHLRRVIEQEDVPVPPAAHNGQVKANPEPVAVPTDLEEFDETLRGQLGYEPTKAFYASVRKYAALDLREQAVGMVGWLAAQREEHPRSPPRACSTLFVLNWLRRTLAERGDHAGHEQRAANGVASRRDPVGRAGPGRGISRQAGTGESRRAIAERWGVVGPQVSTGPPE